MENRGKPIVKTHLINNFLKVHEIKTAKSADILNKTGCSEKKLKFNFGADFLRKENEVSENGEKKTKLENINTAVAPKDVNKISTESLISETEIADESTENANDKCNDEEFVEPDEDDDDDDDDDSYATDEENCSPDQDDSNADEQINELQESDESSTDSDYSDISGLSEVSGREWKPINARPIHWVQKQIHSGANPRELLSQILPSSAERLAPHLNDMTLWRILASMLSEPPRRRKLSYINTFDDVIDLVLQSANIIVLTGAGVSVSCGIPDFRSSDGIYSRLAKDYPDLPDPQAMFDINYFSRDPRPFYKFAREIYPGQFKPSPCHRFIKLLEKKQKLLRNYTQNIDTLEQVAGIQNVIECHGSFSTASCTKCKLKCDADTIRPDIFAQRIPVCPRCQPNVHQSVDASEPVSEEELRRLVENGIMKPDIVFFGEGLPDEFHTVMASDKDKCDLLIVIGSSLKVRPVALIPSSIPANVPQILINREQLHHLDFDVELLGDSDVIINQLCHRLGGDWKDICFDNDVLIESKELQDLEDDTGTEGEGDDIVQQLQDTDTQSIQSYSSTDIALRAAGAYSDSGFESSTSSGIAINKTVASKDNTETNIKINIMEHNKSTANKNKKNMPTPELLDEPMDAVDFALTQESSSLFYSENYRHLSIDSSKDSGIQNDSSNSALPSHSVDALPPPITKFGDSGGTKCNNDSLPTNTCDTQSDSGINSVDNKTTVTDTGRNQKRVRQQKRQSAAERLFQGTFYRHEESSSYVFPGAQVSWSIDTDDETDYESDENDFDDEHNDTTELEDDNTSVVNEDDDADNSNEACTFANATSANSTLNESSVNITCTSAGTTVNNRKRKSTEISGDEAIIQATTNSCETSIQQNVALSNTSKLTTTCSSPPSKKKRDSLEESNEPDSSTSSNNSNSIMTASNDTNTSNTSSNINSSSSGNNSFNSSTNSDTTTNCIKTTTKPLLQHFET